MHTSERPEALIIRPPSEFRSMLIRSVRGCHWNRCKFCGLYPALGEPEFSIRPVADVKRDIDWCARRLSACTAAFIGDSDPLFRPADETAAIIAHLKQRAPRLRRITAYARASTIRRLGPADLRRCAHAGLSRVHIGLESGDPETLRFHKKGHTPATLSDAARLCRECGIEMSAYVLLGLGGGDHWQRHIDGTIAALKAMDPAFIRVRRLWLYGPEDGIDAAESPLLPDVRAGRFMPQAAEGTVLELRRLIAGLSGISSEFLCDHANNYLNVQGKLPGDRDSMLAEVDAFLARPENEREKHYRSVGSTI